MVNFANFTDAIAYFGILNLLTTYLQQDLHFSEVAAGRCVALLTGGVGLCMLVGGSISDFLGVRRAIISSVFILGLGRGLLAFAPNVGGDVAQFIAITAIILMACGTGINQPALYAGMKRYSTSETSGTAFSLLYSFMNVAIVVESLVGPYLRSQERFVGNLHGLGLGCQGVFTVLSCVTFLSFVTMLAFFREDFDVSPSEAAQDQDIQPLGSAKADAPTEKPAYLVVLSNWRFMFFIFCLLPVRTLFAHQWLTVPTYIFRCFPVEINSKFEWFNAINPLVVSICVPIFAIVLKKVRVVDVMLTGTLLSAACTFLLVSPPDVTLMAIYMCLFSLGESIWSSRFYEYVGEIAPPKLVGLYMGLAGLPWFLAKMTTGLYSGWMLSQYVPAKGPQDPQTMWLYYALFASTTPVLLLLARNWLIAGESPRPQAAAEGPIGAKSGD